ncbi:tripartite tricarboxylate transporter substrate binding protein [Aquabacterium sp. J223]|uniref:tripartite tricarboxylate transporter substrate binding protein n=1 Tax=Aquabacterium sp. J223 TaxID=2898431 RepID=UPI0021ADC85F|nr:tripartite tricarboxylate transporter substrate binding protein [Aquabacterium sp. J223]UUX94622.1 tripartite tricarboxylate transporter substrate binding protein [Aquabacterium sp. J223]
MQPQLQKSLGSTVLVDNVAGAGGSIAVQKVLAAAPDGKLMIMGTITDAVLTPLSLKAAKYQGESLRMVGLLSQNPLVLLARADLPVKDAKELVAHARSGHKGLFYGSIGRGSIFHLVTEDLAQQTGLKLTHVAYKGLAPLVQDLMGGQVDLAFYPLAANAFELIKSGRLKALGITGNARVPQLPQVPTFNETGITKGFDYSMWPALFMPAQAPMAEAQRVNDAVAALVASTEFLKFCEETGTTPAKPLSLAETERFYKAEMVAFRKVAATIKLEAE